MVKALASESVVVTGTVPDVRPYLQHADVVVAPLRLSQGVQNKVLEAMAMARPVVVSEKCAEGIDAPVGSALLAALTPADFAGHIERLLDDEGSANQIGDAARRCVVADYNWEVNLSRIDRRIAALAGGESPRARGRQLSRVLPA
jgi:glycosyltransferase involved in cell wall biosynthesis